MYNNSKNKNTIDIKQIYIEICAVLNWLEICIKRTDISKLDDKKQLLAIKYAINMKKHSLLEFKYNEDSLSLYPSDNLYPSEFNILWKILPYDSDCRYDQYVNYNKYLKGKNIIDTIEKIYRIIAKNIN